MDEILRVFGFVVRLTFTSGMYLILQLKFLGRFKKIKYIYIYIFTFKSIFAILIYYR